jgi:hypothetical protein
MRSRRWVVAGALLLALALAGCGPYAREVTNSNRGVNGSSVVTTNSIKPLNGGGTANP